MHETSNGLSNTERFLGCIERSSNIVLIKISIEIEANYVVNLSILAGKEMIPVGPLVQNSSNDKDDPKDELIMQWLNKKDASSTVLICFLWK